MMHLVSSPSAFPAMICGFKVRGWLSGAAEEVCAYHTERMLTSSKGRVAPGSCHAFLQQCCCTHVLLQPFPCRAGLNLGPFPGAHSSNNDAQKERVMGWLPPNPCFLHLKKVWQTNKSSAMKRGAPNIDKIAIIPRELVGKANS